MFYNYLAESRKVRNTISCLRDGSGQCTNDPEEIANLLGAIFESTFVGEPEGITPSRVSTNDVTSIGDLVIEEEDAKITLEKLNTSSSVGPDNVHPKLLKSLSACPAFVKSLTFRECFETGTFPKIWKSATITALHKKGGKLNPENYRPISLTCIVAKCFEKILS